MSIFVHPKQRPLLCIPVTGRSAEEVKAQVEAIVPLQPDLLEWRADFFENLGEQAEVLELLETIHGLTSLPLLFTIRSEREGGEPIALSEEEKLDLLEAVCRSGKLTAVDYEVENEARFVERISELARETGVELVLSYHHFTRTPATEELMALGRRMEAYGASVAKLAVMPETREDVDRLLTFTRELDRALEIPVITMSMGELGVLSRVIGWAYGSVLTFAVGVESSAPGQVPIRKLRRAIEAVQAVTGKEGFDRSL